MDNMLSVVPQVSAPSIQSSAMIVEFNASVWTGRKKDKSASAQVTLQNNAKSGTANVSKKLLGDCAELDAVHKFIGNTRKVKLGDLFNDADYAPVHELRRKFAFNVTYSPVPEAGDFRVDMGNEQAAILKTQYQEHYEAQITKAMGDVFNRTRAVITKLHSEIDWNEGEKSKRIFASVFDQVLEMIDMLRVCNLTGDTQMEAIRTKLEDQFRGMGTKQGQLPLSIEALKDDAHTRAETRAVLEDVISSLPTIDL
jgi:hypothetical protein